MSKYYCHRCSVSNGYYINVYTSEPLGTPYQLAKFWKHTVPSTQDGIVSVFNSTSTGLYERYIIDAVDSGVVEFDHRRHRNIIGMAGEHIGSLYNQGDPLGHQHRTKVVLSSDPERMHAFPTELRTGRCEGCGQPIGM